MKRLLNNTSPFPVSRLLTLYHMTKFLDWSRLKAFADDNLNLAETMKFVQGRVENIVGKGENDFLHFLLFPQCC